MGENLTIGFIGNPNCGKTTLFNAYTGANLKVANWPGVTVEKVEGAIKDHDMNIRLVDLPGTYSLTSYTMEEQVSRQFILSDEVDVIIDVADASALERNLYLTLQLLELGKPVVLALNMMDIVEKRGMEIDTHRLPEMLGIPVIPVSARKRTGLDVLLHAAAHHKDCKDPDCLIHHHKYTSKHRHDHHSEYAMVYSDAIEDKIDLIMAELKRKYPGLTNYRWYAIKLLEQDKEITANYPVDLPDVLDRNYESDIINEKYDFIQEIIREVLVNKDRQDALTEKVDRVLTHKVWSIPIFLVIMAVVFFLTFTIGDWLKGYFEMGIESLSALISDGLVAAGVNEVLRSLLVDGIIAGVGGILTFLPNIFILFLALAFLEDSGYMARVAYNINAGKIRNTGIELTLEGTPFMNENFRWKTAVNMSMNRNKVVSLHKDYKSFRYGSEGFSMAYDMWVKEGGKLGDIYGNGFERDENGKIKLNETGNPIKVTGNNTLLGNANPDALLGWSNTFTYKGFTLYFLIDARIGGDVMSLTQAHLDAMGVSKESGESRDRGYVEYEGIQFKDVPNFYGTVGGRNGISEYYMYDATNVRLRELTLGYSFPETLLAKTKFIKGLDLTLVARNLFFLYKDAPFDPDATLSVGNTLQGVDVFGMPTTRNIGFNVKFTF